MTETQDQAEIFGGGATELRDKRSFDGSDVSSIPAFVFGEELADLADRQQRLSKVTRDLARKLAAKEER